MKAIPTTHRGLNMRSRLEAIWAEVFTQLGWNWYYEPLELDGWIPDFVIDGHGHKPLLVDVKPYASFVDGDDLDMKIRHALGQDINKYNLFVTTAYPIVKPANKNRGLDIPYVGWVLVDNSWAHALITSPCPSPSKVFGLAGATGSGLYGDMITGVPYIIPVKAPALPEFMSHFWNPAINTTQWKRAA
jgi:hypothetical protein